MLRAEKYLFNKKTMCLPQNTGYILDYVYRQEKKRKLLFCSQVQFLNNFGRLVENYLDIIYINII